MAYTDYFDEVQEVYIAYYQRPADPAGLVYWSQRLDGVSGDLTAIINAFATSAESTALYGAIDSSTISAVVTDMYQALFNRAPETGGLNYYVDGFNAGTFTAGTIALDILNGAQNDDLVTINNKLTAADNFTDILDPDHNALELQATYDGNADPQDILDARAFLVPVTHDPTTQYTTGEVLDYIRDNIADPGDPISGQISGETFTLTTGIDAVVGTNGDDIINGFLGETGDDPDENPDTLQVFDTIDGGDGIDTLKVMIASDNTVSVTVAEMTNVENMVLRLTDNAANTSTTLDMSLVSGLENLTVQLLAMEGDSTMDIENLGAALTTLTITGADTTANGGSSDFDLNINTSDSTPLSIQTIVASDLMGSFSVDIDNLENIPVLELTNINHEDDGTINLVVLDTVGTGTDDTLTVVAENAGAMYYGTWESTNINLYNQSGDGVIENLSITTAGDLGSSLDIDGTTNLVNVTIAGSGDLALWLSDSDQVSSFDASDLAGDLSSSVSSEVDVTVALGSGNDYFGLEVDDLTVGTTPLTASIDSGDGNDWIHIDPQDNSADIMTTVTTGAGNDFLSLSDDENTYDINLGAGNDFLLMNNGTGDIATVDSIVGGADFDTLILNVAEFTTNDLSVVTGFENLIADGAGTYDLDLLAGLTTLTVGGMNWYGIGPSAWSSADATAEFQTVGVSSTNDIVFDDVYSGVTTLVLNDTHTGVIEVDLKTDGTANAILVELGNPVDDQTTIGTNLTDQLVLADFETITVNSTGWIDVTADVNTIVELLAGDLTTLNITGDKDLTFSDIGAEGITALLSKINAGAFTGDLTFTDASDTGTAIAYIGGSGVDTYFGTANGDTVNAGAGADVITLDGTFASIDTIIVEAGDSVLNATADGADEYISFGTATGAGALDIIDVGAFGFTGTMASALATKGALAGSVIDGTVLTQADFFNVAGVDRGVAIGTNTGDTYVFIDANQDGDFTAANDMMLQLTGVTDVTLANFGF